MAVAQLRATVADSSDRLRPYIAGWQALADRRGRPLASPAWMLAWWRHVAPGGATLRTAVVEDAGELIGVAPYFIEAGPRHDCRLLASGISQRIEPLAVPGREADVADAFAGALHALEPQPGLVSLEGAPDDSPWPSLLKEALGGTLGAAVYKTLAQDAPVVTLEGRSFEDWFGAKSSNFRQQMRRAKRKLERVGGTIRMAGRDELDADVAALMRLHASRWEGRGESGLAAPGVAAMLREAGAAMIDDGRFRLWIIEVEGRPMSAQLFLAAGGEVAYWNGGFDESWAALKPAMLAILAAIEDAFERGDRRVDLGGGAQPYKMRFADAVDPIQWCGVIPRGARWPRVRVELAPEIAGARARDWARNTLTDNQQERLKKLLRR